MLFNLGLSGRFRRSRENTQNRPPVLYVLRIQDDSTIIIVSNYGHILCFQQAQFFPDLLKQYWLFNIHVQKTTIIVYYTTMSVTCHKVFMFLWLYAQHYMGRYVKLIPKGLDLQGLVSFGR